jgi:putative ABC transport system permease protein
MSNAEERRAEKVMKRLLGTFCPPQLREEIEGDLLQRYERDLKRMAHRKAGLRLIWSATRFARPGIILRNKIRIQKTRFYMIRNHIKIAFRNFGKQKSYTFLNVLGLSLGMAASLLILQYVKYERSFDAFHSRANDIYRIQYNGYMNGELNFESAVAVPAAPAALKANFPEVEQFTRFFPRSGVITYDNATQGPVTFFEEKMQFADSSLFKVFDFPMIKGDPSTALKGLFKTVVTESAARRYFGDEDPIGKKVSLNGDPNAVFEVTGVIRDIPQNSHIRFTFLLSYETLNKWSENGSEEAWGWYDFYSFVLLKPGTDVKTLQAKWDNFLVSTRKAEWDKSGFREEFILRPLLGIHLDSNLLYEAQPDDRRDGDSILALGVVAIFILVIAWVNYVNLATARAMGRANEVGVRKVVGALRSQLIGQFLTESFLLNIIAVAIGLLAVRLLWEPFSSLAGWNIPIAFLFTQEFWWLVTGLFITGALVSGFYPAIILSSFRPVSVLKGKIMRSSQGNVLRKSLVVFQFVASIFLIIGSLTVYQQLQFMKNRDLGVDIGNTLVMRGPRAVSDSTYVNLWNGFKNEAEGIAGIESVSAGSNIPGAEIYWTVDINTLNASEKKSLVTSGGSVDHDYLPSYGIKLLAGRNFSKEITNESDRVIINKVLAEALGMNDLEKAIGQQVAVGDTFEIVGVIDDYHQMSLKSKVAPLCLWYSEDNGTYYSIKLSTTDYSGIVSALEGPWKRYFPGNPIDYFFLDQFFNKQYDKDNRFGVVFNLFTALAILIASLGLFGLASFMALQRTKEIGIRKVLGSSVSGIVLLLSRGFLWPVLIANLLAWPLAWWVMDQWLQTFPYHVSINPLLFILAGTLVLIIAFISVAGQTLKAALLEPARTLKYE